MDIGYDNETGLMAVVNYLRDEPEFNKKALKLREMTFKQFLKTKKNLKEAQKLGFSNLDILQEKITWDVLRTSFNMDELMEFGVDFDIASQIGLRPRYYGGDAGLEILRNMGASDEMLKKTITNLNLLRVTNWSPVTTKKAGFSFSDLTSMGNIAASMTNWTIKQIVFSYKPSGQEWIAAGFELPSVHFDATHYQQFVEPEVAPLREKPTTKSNQMEHNKNEIPSDYILKFEETKLDRLVL